MKTELVQDDLFLKKIYGKALVPCVLSILSGNINLLADGMIVGQYIGPGALAAVSLCVPVYLVLCILGSFLYPVRQSALLRLPDPAGWMRHSGSVARQRRCALWHLW